MLPVLVALLVFLRPAAAADASPEQIERWMDSVVLVLTGPAWCSGVVIDDVGTVATAYHCVASGTPPRVSPRPRVDGDGVARWRHAEGRMIAASPRDDLALVQVPDLAGAVPPLPVREGRPRVGERVYGIGHPYAPLAGRRSYEGMLLWTVTEGVISAVGPRLVQTDAALNPGNSGGPVIDADGRVVGITSRKLGADNIAFLASAERLQALVADPRPPRWVGGDWTVGASVAALQGSGGSTAVELTTGPVVRDRLVLTAGIALPLDARSIALATGHSDAVVGELSGAVRQRLGRGTWSMSLDLGGGVWALGSLEGVTGGGTTGTQVGPTQLRPGLYGRWGLLGGGLRAVLLPGDTPGWIVGVDVDVPGVVAAF